MKRAFVTGITGMVGSHLLDFLIENTDWEVYGFCRWRSPLDNIQQHIPSVNANDRIHLLYVICVTIYRSMRQLGCPGLTMFSI